MMFGRRWIWSSQSGARRLKSGWCTIILNLIMLESMSLALGAQEDEGFKREELDPNMLREAERLQSYGHVPPYAKEGMPEE